MRHNVIAEAVAVFAQLICLQCSESVAHRLASAAARTSVPFDYGWKFRYGPSPDGGAPGPGGDAGFHDISQQGCTGMETNPNQYTAGDCMLACAYKDDCYVWQQDSIHGAHCFHGTNESKCSPGITPTITFGGQRNPVPPVRTTYENAKRTLDDSNWQDVDLPHDFIIYQEFVNSSDTAHGFLPRNVSWYRKSFHVPSDWKGSYIMVCFEGVFHVAQIWLNGQYVQMHTDGYTGFTVRLDNVTGIEYGKEATNVLAVRVDASFGSGHWYEGGGIYRRTHLVRTGLARFVQDGVYVSPEIDLESKRVSVSAEIDNVGNDRLVCVLLTLYGSDDNVMASNKSYNVSLAIGFPQTIEMTLLGSLVQEWSIQKPNMYKVEVVLKDAVHGDVLDSVNVSAGFRQTSWTVSEGFMLNGNALKFRGFSHHNSFAGVGTAMPERIHLFRVQASRAVGGTFWRMSHNPYLPALYDFLDVLGVLAWDENRDYGPEYVGAMHDMVKRDRGHPSVVVWSYCNEVECIKIKSNNTGLAFRFATRELDPQRPTSANGFTNGLDVQGMSHAPNQSFIDFHQQHLDVPLILSECCSAKTQRRNRVNTLMQLHDQNSPAYLPYVAGSIGVWTLFDYYGESKAWPAVSCSFGQFDLAGFPKPNAYWYLLNWLAAIDESDKSLPPVPRSPVTRITDLPDHLYTSVAVLSSGLSVELFIDGKSHGKQATNGSLENILFTLPVLCDFKYNLDNMDCGPALQFMPSLSDTEEHCKESCCQSSGCTVWQYTDYTSRFTGCHYGNIDVAFCKLSKMPWIGKARTQPTVSSIRNLTAVSLDEKDKVIGTHTLLASGIPVAIVLTLDVPSPTTATGSKLVLDGHDAALVRASVVDENNVLVTNSSVDIEIGFNILSGPVRQIGIGNGDIYNLFNGKRTSIPAYGGLVRGIFQVTADCVSDNRDLILAIDESRDGPTQVYPPSSCTNATKVIIEAYSLGLKSGYLTFEVSSSPTDLPLEVAKRSDSLHLDSFTYLTEFTG